MGANSGSAGRGKAFSQKKTPKSVWAFMSSGPIVLERSQDVSSRLFSHSSSALVLSAELWRQKSGLVSSS